MNTRAEPLGKLIKAMNNKGWPYGHFRVGRYQEFSIAEALSLERGGYVIYRRISDNSNAKIEPTDKAERELIKNSNTI